MILEFVGISLRVTPEGQRIKLSFVKRRVVMNRMKFGYEVRKTVGFTNKLAWDRVSESVWTDDCDHGGTACLHLAHKEASACVRWRQKGQL